MGGSFDAFKWAKDQRVGDGLDKLLLIMMADKVDVKFELYPSRAELSADIELSEDKTRKHLNSLQAKGFVIVIERLRPNGSQGYSKMLVNHPDAPHMHGDPITLDFEGKHHYPKFPAQLREAGIQWISGGELNATREDHAGSKSAGNPGGTKRSPRGGTKRAPGGNETFPPGGNETCPLASPHWPHPPTTGTADAVDGWLDEPKGAKKESSKKTGSKRATSQKAVPDTAGGALLYAYGVVGSPLMEWTPVVDHALSQMDQRDVEQILGGGSSEPGPGAIVSTRLPALQAKLTRVGRNAPRESALERVPWCGECDYPESRNVEDEQGRAGPCPRCHPAYTRRHADEHAQSAA